MNGDLLSPPPPAVALPFPVAPKDELVDAPTTRIPGASTATGTGTTFVLPNVPSLSFDGGLANPSSSPAASQLSTLPFPFPFFPFPFSFPAVGTNESPTNPNPGGPCGYAYALSGFVIIIVVGAVVVVASVELDPCPLALLPPSVVFPNPDPDPDAAESFDTV
jgi:hypothetical protein